MAVPLSDNEVFGPNGSKAFLFLGAATSFNQQGLRFDPAIL
jgi:hypothetical protein